jgi:hypothetical protein
MQLVSLLLVAFQVVPGVIGSHGLHSRQVLNNTQNSTAGQPEASEPQIFQLNGTDHTPDTLGSAGSQPLPPVVPTRDDALSAVDLWAAPARQADDATAAPTMANETSPLTVPVIRAVADNTTELPDEAVAFLESRHILKTLAKRMFCTHLRGDTTIAWDCPNGN